MTITGYSTTTRANLLIGAAMLYRDTTTVLGAMRGNTVFEKTETVRQPVMNNVHSPVRGLDFIAARGARLRGVLLEQQVATDNTLEFDNALPMSAASATGFGTLTWAQLGAETWAQFGALGYGPLVQMLPGKAMTLIAVGAYLANVRLDGILGDGTLLRVHFPFAKVASWSRKSNVGAEAETTIVLEAVLEPSGSPLDVTAVPFTIQRV